MGDNRCMSVRYFRTADETAYEGARLGLDAAWGLPANGQQTCFEPAATAPRDDLGRIYLSLYEWYCDMTEAASMLSAMLASGAAQEITREEYFSAVGKSLRLGG